jgi:hypothetical protein
MATRRSDAMLKLTLIAAAGLAVCVEAQAQVQPSNQAERFRLEKSATGVVRLDTQTGAMTLCREENGNLVCRMAADERAAYEAELDQLEKRVTALEERLKTAPPRSLPSDEEVDRSLSIMERFFRRFLAIIEEFTGPRPGQPQPDRT